MFGFTPHPIDVMLMNPKRLMIFTAALLVVIQLIGCSGQVPLSGRVVFSDDDSPVPTGTICFTDGITASRGTINADGTFVLGSTKMDDGISPGHYTVYFVGVEVPNPENAMATKPLIDRKYASPDTSGLGVEVTSATKTMEFKLNRF